jgi:valyl-tRNA synthetase
MKKLGNKSFVENAPERVVENELRKKSDAEVKIDVLKKRIEHIKNQS